MATCKHCGKEFGSDEALHQHTASRHAQAPASPSRKKNHLLYGGVVVVFAVAIVVLYTTIAATAGQYDDFAQCLTDEGATIYGAYWCQNCERQKLTFGDSFHLVDYIECDETDPEGKGQPHLCEAASITSYPTWIFDDGQRIVGSQSLQQLADVTGCSL